MKNLETLLIQINGLMSELYFYYTSYQFVLIYFGRRIWLKKTGFGLAIASLCFTAISLVFSYQQKALEDHSTAIVLFLPQQLKVRLIIAVQIYLYYMKELS